jgi:hypothetical protein
MRRLVFRIEQFEAPAKAKSSDWGYDRIAGVLANLGYEISEWVMDGQKPHARFRPYAPQSKDIGGHA